MSRPKVAVVTGGAQGIGKAICDAFIKEGVNVCTIDLQDNDYFVGDIADEYVLKQFAEKVISEYGSLIILLTTPACRRVDLIPVLMTTLIML